MTIHLKDNRPNDTSSLPDSEDACGFLRYLSSHSIKEFVNDKYGDVLIFPRSFSDIQDCFANSYVLQYVETFDGKPEGITTGNIVGFIGKGNVDIRIRSRFSNGDDDYFLYYMMEKVLAVNMVNFKTSTSRKDAVFDLMFIFFPKLLKEALSQGVYKQYVYHEYNDANVRGAIDINRHIRYNIPFNGRIAYRTREFSYDNPVTQLIRHTIEFVRKKPFGQSVLHNDAEMEGCVQQIILATPTYTDRQRQAVVNDNLRPFSHPYFTKYAALIKLCLSILRHERLAYGDNKDEKVYGVLIDAAWLWEEYIAGVVNEIGGNHYTKKNSKYKLFKDEGGGFQQIVPDYLYPGEEDGKNTWVADAKYIPLDEEQNKNMSADRAGDVYYKTIMYMYRFNTEKGFLLHPVRSDSENKVSLSTCSIENGVSFSTYSILGGRGGKLHKVGICIPQSEDRYASFKKTIGERENAFKEKIEKLVGGDD